jgi:cell wall-associated NlpC family hydrolase
MKHFLFVALFACGCLAADNAATQPTHTPPPEIRRGMVYRPTTNPEDREERQRIAIEQVVRRIEPNPTGDASRLPQYLEFFKREFVKDPRVFAFDASAEARGAGRAVVLTGDAEYPQHRQAIDRLLHALGFGKVDNRIELLPSTDLGDRPYAIVTADHTGLFDRPQSPHEQLSECLKDEPVFLLKTVRGDSGDDYYLCHNAEGYVGHVAAADLRVVDRASILERLDPPHAIVVDERIERVIASAKSILGTKYVWGGKTDEGLDCSGLVQRAYRAAGVNLPRDADQQALVGRMVATRWLRDAMQPGDVMFFLSGRGTVSHTAIYLGGGKFIEASGTVRISSLNEGDENFERRRAESFCFARRIFD